MEEQGTTTHSPPIPIPFPTRCCRNTSDLLSHTHCDVVMVVVMSCGPRGGGWNVDVVG